MITYRWTSTIIAVAIAAIIVWLVRRNHLHARTATWWIFLAIVIVVAGTFPEVVDILAAYLGVHYPPILIVALGMAILLIKILNSDIEHSKEQQQMRILIQKLTVLEAQLESRNDPESGVDRQSADMRTNGING